MSDRLNKRSRGVLLGKLTDKAFKKKFEVLAAKKKTMFAKVMASVFRAEAKWLAAAPKGALPTSGYLEIVMRGDNTVALQGDPVSVPYTWYTEHVRYHYNRTISWDSLSKKITTGLATELKAFLDECVALDKEHEKFKSEARAVLDSVTTVKRLYEVWPELNELMPPVVDQTVSVGQQLAPVTADLNRALGIGNGAKS